MAINALVDSFHVCRCGCDCSCVIQHIINIERFNSLAGHSRKIFQTNQQQIEPIESQKPFCLVQVRICVKPIINMKIYSSIIAGKFYFSHIMHNDTRRATNQSIKLDDRVRKIVSTLGSRKNLIKQTTSAANIQQSGIQNHTITLVEQIAAGSIQSAQLTSQSRTICYFLTHKHSND